MRKTVTNGWRSRVPVTALLRRIAWILVACSAAGGLAQAAGDGSSRNAPGLVIHEPWARATAPAMKNGAAYLTIENRGRAADRLVSASAAIAARVELHRTEIGENGVMRMREARGIEIPAGESVKIAPGGYHVMLVGLKGPLVKGATFPLTLRFEKAGAREVTVTVRGIRAMPGGHR